MPSRRRPRPKKSQIALALAKVLSAHRERLGLTQEAFAERVGLSKNYIGNLERGEHEPSINILTMIARECNISASRLLDEAGF